MPFLTIIHAVVDFVAYFITALNPVYALTVSIFLLCGWSIQAGFWAQCDLPDNLETASNTCYQSYIQRTTKGSDLEGVSTGLAQAKVAFGFIVLIM